MRQGPKSLCGRVQRPAKLDAHHVRAYPLRCFVKTQPTRQNTPDALYRLAISKEYRRAIATLKWIGFQTSVVGLVLGGLLATGRRSRELRACPDRVFADCLASP